MLTNRWNYKEKGNDRRKIEKRERQRADRLFRRSRHDDSAIEGIKNWDRINDHFELGAIGTIYKEGDKIKTKLGRKTGKGAKIGKAAVVGVIGAVLTGARC